MSVPSESYNMIFKLVLIGDSFVGKTNILNKYLHDKFDQDSKATVGVEFGSKNFEIDGNHIKAQIWDTAGQERYRSLTNAYYKGALGALLVYDITKRKTFESVDKWMPDLKTNGDKNIFILLIGNKNDLEDQREVSVEEAKQKAAQYNVAFLETSAKTGTNINEAFDLMVKEVYKSSHVVFESAAQVELNHGKPISAAMSEEAIDEQGEGKKKDKGCC